MPAQPFASLGPAINKFVYGSMLLNGDRYALALRRGMPDFGGDLDIQFGLKLTPLLGVELQARTHFFCRIIFNHK